MTLDVRTAGDPLRDSGQLVTRQPFGAPVAVAPVDPLQAAGAVLGTADGVGLRGQHGLDEGAEELAQQIRAGLGELFLEQAGGVDTGPDGHRGVLLRVAFRGSLEGSPGGRRLLRQRHAPRDPYPTLPGVTDRRDRAARLSARPREVWCVVVGLR